MLLILGSILFLSHLSESVPSTIYRPVRSVVCSTPFCLSDPSSCYCGSEAPAADSCCQFQCRRCPDDFVPQGWNFGIGSLNLGPLTLTENGWVLFGR